jgi:CBS domain-containing protein
VPHVAVEDAQGTAIGLVSMGELRDTLAPTIAVREVMDSSPPMVEPDELLSVALERLAAAGTDALLVVRDGALLGIATRGDLERATARTSRAA